MTIRIITASAGSGKTTRLSQVLDDAIASGTVRPEGIIATTFTRHAAAELIERARARLLASGRGREAHQLLTARIGTVNAMCGSLVTDFAFELGLSPSLRVLDEGSSELEQKRSLASVVLPAVADELHAFRSRFDKELDWHHEVRQLIEAARANGLDAAQLLACGVRSSTSLDACLGAIAADGDAIDHDLITAIDDAVRGIDRSVDTTAVTDKYLQLLEGARSSHHRGCLKWGEWAKLAKEKPGKKSAAFAVAIQQAAARHIEHPRLRAEMHRLIELLFQVAAQGLAAYQAHKRELGVIDFVDQEVLALQLLRRDDVREVLRGQIDLVLIDEFQDTSPLQLAIFLELATLGRDSVWVGDQKQAIYGFRGTDPALMDAMIESLTSSTADPDLVSAAVEALGHEGLLETLETSYRSRPELVAVTSDLFAQAFVKHGIPEERTRLTPALTTEPPDLGPTLEYWPLRFDERESGGVRASATAAGVSRLLASPPNVRDRRTAAPRVATSADVAVLCRTNNECQVIANHLAQLGIAAVVPRLALLDTAEGHMVSAGLRLWIDPGDALAAAELARLVHYAANVDDFVARAIAAPGRDAFAADPIVSAILAARAATPDLEPAAAVAAVIDASNLRELCASWGNTAQRHANLDALRAHAIAYVSQAVSRREAPSLVGLLGNFAAMIDEWDWASARTDDQALLAASEAVTVSTWHAAKGREWPLTVLFGLEHLREPRAFGVHIESDAAAFDLRAPLAGRWIRYWPNPYTTTNQLGAVKTAFAQSSEYQAVVARNEREALRLLYVGWTRARDRLIFAASEGKLLDGLVGTVSRLVPGLISEPPAEEDGDIEVQWGGRTTRVHVHGQEPALPVDLVVETGEVTVGLGVRTYAPGRISPSSAVAIECVIGTPVILGPRLSMRGSPEMGSIGDAVHGFLAVDRPEHDAAARIERAGSLLAGHGVASHLDAAEVVDASTRLWTWLSTQLGATRLHREWPVAHRDAAGSIIAGTADLVARTSDGLVLIDHKTFPGSLEDALVRLKKYSGQLATYARAIAGAGSPVVSIWIHLPVLGVMVPMTFGTTIEPPRPRPPPPPPAIRSIGPAPPPVTTDLPQGLYEHVVTTQLARQLEASSAQKDFAPIDDADAHALLARHVGREVERALNTLPREGRRESTRDIVNKLLEHLATLVGDDAAEALRDQFAVAPAKRLMSIHRGGAPARPTSPLSTSTLLTRNKRDPALGHELAREIATADQVDAIVAFVTVGGVRAIHDSLHQFARREGSKLRLLTTTFTGTTEVAALDSIARLPGARVKISYDTRRTRLHAKAWLFQRNTGLTTCYVGSANLTSTALGTGQEWMVKACHADVPHIVERFQGTFDTLWEDPEFEDYNPDDESHRVRLKAALNAETSHSTNDTFLVSLRPFPFQLEILDKLTVERTIHNRKRNLVVAATGTGKTVVAAFDYARQCEATGVPPRLLFLAHRRELLEQARKTFQYVLQDASFGEFLVGGVEPTRFEHVFASIQSVASSGLIDRLGPGHFRHVIVDECHHMPASSYQSAIPRLRPELLVGLTATPERADGKSLLPDFDGHVAAELRLWHALDDQLLVPFEYFGISDGTDLRNVRWSKKGYDVGALGELFTGNDARVALIRHQLTRRVNDVRAIRALGFCVSVAHADFMAARFTAAGIPSRAVHGTSSTELREQAPALLRERTVNVLFTCDLYNEGVDLPYVDTLLLLRPTSSTTVFMQQLGRGLRHAPGKSSCLVLDFIGQHHDEFRFDTTLAALTGIPRAQLRKSIEDGFPYLPSGCALQLDAVSRQQILQSLRATLGGAVRLAAEIKGLASTGSRPSLATFLDQTGRELSDIYDAGGWTTLLRRAELEPDGNEVEDEVSRRLGWIQHIDDEARLRTYGNAIAAAAEGKPYELSSVDRTRIQMLDYQLTPRGVMRAAEETVKYIASAPAIAREFRELRSVLEERIGIAEQHCPVPDWPLALHHHYSRREIVAAVGFVKPGDKGKLPQGGVLKVDSNRELLFVTLDKSGKEFSPTTRYRDYAMSPELFHWETQAAASIHTSGRRYVESAANGWTFHLFVRTTPEDVYGYLGPVRYQSHSGDRPIAITWRLEHPMAASLYEQYATLKVG